MQPAATTKELLVVKIGGAAGVAHTEICADVAALHRAGQPLVLVHGGSDMATQLGAQLGHPAAFVTTASGHSSRYTDARTLEIFLMATALTPSAFNRAHSWRLSSAVAIKKISSVRASV